MDGIRKFQGIPEHWIKLHGYNLDPCPICESRVWAYQTEYYIHVSCEECGCTVGPIIDSKEVEKKWNRRSGFEVKKDPGKEPEKEPRQREEVAVSSEEEPSLTEEEKDYTDEMFHDMNLVYRYFKEREEDIWFSSIMRSIEANRFISRIAKRFPEGKEMERIGRIKISSLQRILVEVYLSENEGKDEKKDI